jgi:hypothetical protein
MLHAEVANGYAFGTILVYALIAIFVIGGIIIAWLNTDWIYKAASIGIAVLLSLLTYGIFVWAAWPPYAMQYHTYQPTTITVDRIANRFISDGNKSVNQRIVIATSSGALYGCDDTRCATLEKGQVVTLLCTQEWQGNANAGEVCNWGKLGNN